MKNLRIKKVIVIASLVVCMMGISCILPSAASKIQTSLTGSVHYVPILNDNFTATTAVPYYKNYKMTQNKTWVYVYDKSGKCNKSYNYSYGAGDVEGTSGKAVAGIRNCYRAASKHQGKSDSIKNWQTVTRSWKRK